MFQEPNCMLFYLCNILYRIVERLSLLHGCRHGWSNNVTNSCIFIVYLFVLKVLLSTSKLSLAQQTIYKILEVKLILQTGLNHIRICL